MCRSGGYINLITSSGFLPFTLYTFLCFYQNRNGRGIWCALLLPLPEFNQNSMMNISWCAILLPQTSKGFGNKYCARVSPETKNLRNKFMCSYFSSSTSKSIDGAVMRELLLPQTFEHGLRCFCLIPGSATQQRFRNHSRSPRWAVLGTWVVYKSPVFCWFFLFRKNRMRL